MCDESIRSSSGACPSGSLTESVIVVPSPYTDSMSAISSDDEGVIFSLNDVDFEDDFGLLDLIDEEITWDISDTEVISDSKGFSNLICLETVMSESWPHQLYDDTSYEWTHEAMMSTVQGASGQNQEVFLSALSKINTGCGVDATSREEPVPVV